jgi:hypothetical protein
VDTIYLFPALKITQANHTHTVLEEIAEPERYGKMVVRQCIEKQNRNPPAAVNNGAAKNIHRKRTKT